MPSTTKSPAAVANEQRAVVRSLSQAVAAELVGKPSVWLRDNSHKSGRNADGSYNGCELVQNLLRAQPSATLGDEMLEGVRQIVETVQPENARHDLALAALVAVESRYGTAGLAAIGAELVRHFRLWCELDSFARRDYAKIVEAGGVSPEPKPLFSCECCGRYRMGDKWLAPPLPAGYIPHPVGRTCEKCRKAA